MGLVSPNSLSGHLSLFGSDLSEEIACTIYSPDYGRLDVMGPGPTTQPPSRDRL